MPTARLVGPTVINGRAYLVCLGISFCFAVRVRLAWRRLWSF